MNEVTLVGNLTADPVYRVAEQSGRGVARFDIAVNRRRFERDSQDYKDLPTVYHRVVAFGPLADHVKDSLNRGHEVVVVGTFADDSYQTEEGEKRRQLVLEAQVSGQSLRFGTTRFTKAQKLTNQHQQSREAYDGE